MPCGNKFHDFLAQAFFIIEIMNTKTIPFPLERPKPARRRRGLQAVISLDRSTGDRVYLDLNEGEKKWLRSIAAAYSLTIEEFIQKFHAGELPGPPFAREGQDSKAYSKAELGLFTVTCNDPAVWRQVEAIARYDEVESAMRVCLNAILSTLECSNETLLFDPRTGAVLCDGDDIRFLEFRTNLPQEPALDRQKHIVRGVKKATRVKGKRVIHERAADYWRE